MADISKAEDSKVMHILLATFYKDTRVYVRRIFNVFIWDVIYKDELYSNSLYVGSGKIKEDVTDEAVDICFAGACKTIDMLNDDKKEVVN